MFLDVLGAREPVFLENLRFLLRTVKADSENDVGVPTESASTGGICRRIRWTR